MKHKLRWGAEIPLFLIAPKSIWATYLDDEKHLSGNQTQAPIVTTHTNTRNYLTRMNFAYHFLTGVTALKSSISGEINQHKWKMSVLVMQHAHLGCADSPSLQKTPLLPAKWLNITVL